jgi:MarR family
VIICCLRMDRTNLQVMSPVLRLNLPWLPDDSARINELVVRRGSDDVLTFDDGISLQVRVLDPASYRAAEGLVADASEAEAPGRLVLVAGTVPVEWRAELRRAGLSFMDVGGVVDISWPRLRVTTGQFAKEALRRRDAMPLQQGHALVAEELLIAAMASERPTVTELARRARVSVSTASRTVAQLASHGLVEREQAWRQVAVQVSDPDALANLLADRTAWPGREVIGGYVWGRNIWDVAAVISRNADAAGVAMAITGRVGAAFHGILGTSSPPELRCWATLNGQALEEVAGRLGLEPAPRESINVRISADPWHIGTHRRAQANFDVWTATVAHPLRVWCDLRDEERGREFAAQLWGRTRNAW